MIKEVTVESGMTISVAGGHYIKTSVRISKELDVTSDVDTEIDDLEEQIEAAIISNLETLAEQVGYVLKERS